MRIGILSDTHGILRPEVIYGLEDCEVIIHAGDIGDENILQELGSIATTYAVRGNNDQDRWARLLPEYLEIELEGYSIFVVHDIKTCGDLKDYDLVIFGHSHQLKVAQERKRLMINPGACGKSRFGMPLTLVKLDLGKDKQVSVNYI